MNCRLCKRALDQRAVRHPSLLDGAYRIIWCDGCRNGFLDPFPAPEDRAVLYDAQSYRSKDGGRFLAPVERIVECFSRQKSDRIERSEKRGGAILDIGCGRGLFLQVMARRGWEVMGVEVSESAAECARSTYGIRVQTAAEMDTLPRDHYDVVTLYHVLEHLEDPDDLIGRCRALLKNDGLLVVAVPNLASLQARWGGDAWFHLDVPFHLFHFSRDGLSALLQRHGFRVVRTKHFDAEQNIYGWYQTLLNRAGITRNLLYRYLKRRELRQAGLPQLTLRDGLLMAVAGPVLLPVAIILSFFEAAVLRNGGTVELHARLDKK